MVELVDGVLRVGATKDLEFGVYPVTIIAKTMTSAIKVKELEFEMVEMLNELPVLSEPM